MLSLSHRRGFCTLFLIVALATTWSSVVVQVRSEEAAMDEEGSGSSGSPPQDLPGVMSLTDETFEHQTQASTGQTTGSWLVWFYEDEDDAVEGAFPSESEWLEDHIVVGAVDVATKGIKVKERFAMNKLPAFVFFHKGSMYRYPVTANEGFSWEAIREFCKNPDPSLGEAIQPPPSFFSELWSDFQNHPTYPVIIDMGKYYIKIMSGLGVILVVGLFIKAVIARLEGGDQQKEKRS